MSNVVGPDITHMVSHACPGTCSKEIREGRDCESGRCEYHANFLKEQKNGRVEIKRDGRIGHVQPKSY